MKDYTVRKTLLGTTGSWDSNVSKHRTSTIIFPAGNDGDIERKITYMAADGLVLYLLKRIEKLELAVLVKNKR